VSWNKLEVTKATDSEYRIYHGIHTDEVYPIANTFAAFVELCCKAKVDSGNPPETRAPDWTVTPFGR